LRQPQGRRDAEKGARKPVSEVIFHGPSSKWNANLLSVLGLLE